MKTPVIIHEDNHVLVAIKPPGVLSQDDGSGAPDMLTLIKNDLKIRYDKPGNVFLGLVHRLDRPVGGLMVFAKTSKAASRLSEQVRNRKITKQYMAVVHGNLKPESGLLEDYLLKDTSSNMVRVTGSAAGKLARLDYRMVAYHQDPSCSLAVIRLVTGRPHQIRVQFASRGFPLLGDRRYGENLAGRGDLALYAAGLGFTHPVSKAWMSFASTPDMKYPWNLFRIADYETMTQEF